MSTEATERVWNHSGQKGSALLMLLGLADQADAYGYCWPSVATASQRARVTERQGKRLLDQLEAAGELIIQRGAGRGNTSRYIVTPGMDAERIATSLVARFGLTPVEAVECARQCIERRERSQKGDIQREKVTSSALKGDIQRENVTPTTPFNEAEKVTSSALKGDIQREKVTPGALKGDIAMSPDPIGWLVDHSVPDGEINQPTSAPDPPIEDAAEIARTVALLMDPAVGIGHAKARDLATRFGFEEVRRQVAAWLPQFEAGRAQAGLLIKRIEDRWGAPDLSAEFRRSALYRRHRTEAERQADAELEADIAAMRRAYQVDCPPPDNDDPPDALQQVLAGLANIDLHDAQIALDGETLTLTFPPHRVQYARHQYARPITRALCSAGLSYRVEFTSATPTEAPP